MKISIVTPSYNQGRFIVETIKSVISQENADFQYIVVDAESNDGTRQVLEKYQHAINKLIIEPDDGQADALAKGFSHADGDIYCYLNSDDVFIPDTFAYVARYFEEHADVDAIYSHRLFIDESGAMKRVRLLPPHMNRFIERWDFIPQETCFFRSSAFVNVGGIDGSFQFAMDYDLFLRMMRKGRFVRVNKFLAAFRVHPDSKSSSQYDTTGRREIITVKANHGISVSWYDWLFGYLVGGAIFAISALSACLPQHLYTHIFKMRSERESTEPVR